MKVIGIQNPYAWMIVSGFKKVEYRSWKTNHRGVIAIHASLQPAFDWEPDEEYDGVLLPAIAEMDFGALIGTVEIADCIQQDGQWNWVLQNPKKFDKPIYCGGKRGVWDFVPDAESGEKEQPAKASPATPPPPDRVVKTAIVATPPLQRPKRLAAAETTSTPYHSKYIAHELTRRLSSDNAEKLSQSLLNATVDLNPHQVEAALFAFRSPLSRGAILADEVGLGKTIEAGLIISQLWAERKRRILCILPAALRKQWNRELTEKFFIDSVILEARNFNSQKKKGNANPFLQENRVVICSYHFARSKADSMQAIPWDLVVIDEAHRLRNVYKKGNKIARTIRDSIESKPKLLLTATPLQNSLMELYGLVSFVDEHTFGSEESFREQYVRGGDFNNDAVLFQSLRARIQHLCQRTLRRQVTEYVRYTKRIPITQDFTPHTDELSLYNAVSAYMQKEELIALPSSQRKLITLILRKILASSSFAIATTLTTLIRRLEIMQRQTSLQAQDNLIDAIGEDFENAEEMQDENAEDDDAQEDGNVGGSIDAAEAKSQIEAITKEVNELKNYRALAESITANAKGDALLVALKKGFKQAAEIAAPQKALVFTESRRTQNYLRQLLEDNGYAGQLILFNGTNSDPASKKIHQEWLARHKGQECVSGSPSADMRSALVEQFAERASIMIATESAAEGVNLQFCNLVVNYDLPWNPQRIEQRIGRCHRYGQEHDVVVVNFLNRSNEADQRVFELLSEKFKLFDGVFGASDEVMGALETGVDFEKRIGEIYQKCRTSDEIKEAFDRLQQEFAQDHALTGAFGGSRKQMLDGRGQRVLLERRAVPVQPGRAARIERLPHVARGAGVRPVLTRPDALVLASTPCQVGGVDNANQLARIVQAGQVKLFFPRPKRHDPDTCFQDLPHELQGLIDPGPRQAVECFDKKDTSGLDLAPGNQVEKLPECALDVLPTERRHASIVKCIRCVLVAVTLDPSQAFVVLAAA